MPRVPSSYVIMEAEIEADEIYTSTADKRDAATVTMVAAIDATFAQGYVDTPDAAPEVVAQVTSANSTDFADAATAQVVAVITADDGKEYTDAATAQVDATTTSGVDIRASVDVSEAIVVSVPSALDTRDGVLASTVTTVGIVSGADDLTHNYVDADTAQVQGIASADDIKAHDYTDLDTALVQGMDGDSPASHDEHDQPDAATVQTQGIASGTDAYGTEDADTALVVGIPSGIDGKEWSDSATAQVQGIPSGVEDYTQQKTLVQLFGDQHYGGSGTPGDPSRYLDMDLGGTATAGDWFVVGVVSSAGFSAPGSSDLVVTDNISGATGWTKLLDTSQGSGAYGSGVTHVTWWKKLCVGGESHVRCEFGGSTNKAIAGAWLKAPTQPTLYKIDSGAHTWNGTSTLFNSSAFPLTNNEPYICIVMGGGSGVSNPTRIDMTTPSETDALYELAGGECWAHASYNNVESGHATTDTFLVTVQGNIPAYTAIFGLKTP